MRVLQRDVGWCVGWTETLQQFVVEYNRLAVPDVGRPLLTRSHKSSYYDRLVTM